MKAEPLSQEMTGRVVVAIVNSISVTTQGDYRFFVDCITDNRYPQAFAVKVLFDEIADIYRLANAWSQNVVLDETMKFPAYILLDRDTIVTCEVTDKFGDSNKDFSFIV